MSPGRPLAALFLWHMHQPSYVDGVSGAYRVPWVRLHAAKGYYDMIGVLRPFDRVKVTFNLTPCLVQQLEDYARLGLDTPEAFLQHSLKPADSLSESEVEFLLGNFFHANWETMIRPNPGYGRLLEKRGQRLTPVSIAEAKRLFSRHDLLDLQVWFNLAWCGFMACRDLPQIADLKQKGMGFSEDDKTTVLDAHFELIKRVLAEYRQMAEQGRIEISASPMYHPILPLLIDTDFAARGDPGRRLPERFSAPEDARAQVRRGLDLHERVLGLRPKGMWPSEGSVCPELVPILADEGIEWIATDEEVLKRSLSRPGPRDEILYTPYRARYEGKEVKVIFRDHQLSDLIGFTYSKNPGRASAEDFMRQLGRIAASSGGGGMPRSVAVVLDGENAWEYFRDGGEGFLQALYGMLNSGADVRAVGISDFLAEQKDLPAIERIHSGSWINANYNIWIGGPEENSAWALLGRTRRALLARRDKSPEPDARSVERAWDMLFQAEGSDWFWWYDDDFTSEMDEEFDALFRSKLAGVHLALGEPVPDELDRPVARLQEKVRLLEPPLDFISPRIDGRITHFYEWENAGYINLGQVRGSMHLTKSFLSNFFYGFDLSSLYIRLDPAADLDRSKEVEARLLIEGPRTFMARFQLKFDGPLKEYELEQAGGVRKMIPMISGSDIIEMAVPFAEIGAAADQTIRFSLRLVSGEIEHDAYPRHGSISIQVPDRSFTNLMWSC